MVPVPVLCFVAGGTPLLAGGGWRWCCCWCCWQRPTRTGTVLVLYYGRASTRGRPVSGQSRAGHDWYRTGTVVSARGTYEYEYCTTLLPPSGTGKDYRSSRIIEIENTVSRSLLI